MSRTPRPRPGYYLYACGCKQLFELSPPRIGDELICRRHGETVVTDVAAQWVVKCHNCAFEYGYGEYGRIAAERGAAGHRKRKAGKGHTVEILTPAGERHHLFDGAGAALASADFIQ
jgi:hypothetical protein